MRDYAERIARYEEEAKELKKEVKLMNKTMVYLRQRYPDVWALLGSAYFVSLAMLCFVGLIAKAMITETLNLMFFRNILFIDVVLAWGLFSPIHVTIMKKRQNAEAAKYPKMSIVEYQIENFKLYQIANNKSIRSKIYEEVSTKLKNKEKMKNKTNQQGLSNENKIKEHKKRYEKTLKDIDNRLTEFINNDYSVSKYFESYLSWSKSQNIIEGMMCGLLFMLVWNLPYFGPVLNNDGSKPALILALFIPAVIGLLAPITICCIHFHWKKKAFRQIMSSSSTEIVHLKSKYWDIEDKVNNKLDELMDEYILTLVEMEDY